VGAAPVSLPRPRLPALRYRPARPADVETLAELATIAYRVSSLEKRREFYTDHPRFELSDVRVGELEGRIVASLVLYPIHAWVRGQKVAISGVGSVAVSPEHRRRGIGDSLMRSALREMRQQGSPFSMLYAWRGSYYRRYGYGVVELVHQLAMSPANLPASDHARGVRRLELSDRPAVEALYERVASQGHFALARHREWWSERLWTYPGDWVVHEGGQRGEIEGYVHYEMDSTQGAFRLAMTLDEFVAATPQAHRGLAGYLASLADQVTEIHFAAPADNAWLAVLDTAQNLRPGAEIGLYTDSGGVAAGAMLRVIDVEAGLEALPVSPLARGEVVLEVDDPILPANARAWRVSAREGRLEVAGEGALDGAQSPRAGAKGARSGARSAGAGAGRLPRLRVPAEFLGPIVAGTLSPTRAAEIGLVDSSGGAEAIEHWFRGRPAFVYQLNGF